MDSDTAAFGSTPGMWPLAAASTPEGLWLRAVAAGGQGRYAAAQVDLDRLLRGVDRGPLASLALSTRGSFLRQLGWHERARSYDGAAWASSGGHGEAAADALIGLAAAALGHAERAVELASHMPSVRHRVKSSLVLAAARCAAGDLDAARDDGDRVLAQTGEHGLIPLRWAAASLLAGIGSAQSSAAQI